MGRFHDGLVLEIPVSSVLKSPCKVLVDHGVPSHSFPRHGRRWTPVSSFLTSFCRRFWVVLGRVRLTLWRNGHKIWRLATGSWPHIPLIRFWFTLITTQTFVVFGSYLSLSMTVCVTVCMPVSVSKSIFIVVNGLGRWIWFLGETLRKRTRPFLFGIFYVWLYNRCKRVRLVDCTSM